MCAPHVISTSDLIVRRHLQAGWDKQQSYVVACGVGGVADVTRRYTGDMGMTRRRRGKVPEAWLSSELSRLTRRLRAPLPPALRQASSFKGLLSRSSVHVLVVLDTARRAAKAVETLPRAFEMPSQVLEARDTAEAADLQAAGSGSNPLPGQPLPGFGQSLVIMWGQHLQQLHVRNADGGHGDWGPSHSIEFQFWAILQAAKPGRWSGAPHVASWAGLQRRSSLPRRGILHGPETVRLVSAGAARKMPTCAATDRAGSAARPCAPAARMRPARPPQRYWHSVMATELALIYLLVRLTSPVCGVQPCQPSAAAALCGGRSPANALHQTGTVTLCELVVGSSVFWGHLLLVAGWENKPLMLSDRRSTGGGTPSGWTLEAAPQVL